MSNMRTMVQRSSSRILFSFILLQLQPVLTMLEPKFDMQTVNVTAKEKSTAELPCSVSSLGNFQVVWTDQFSTLLTYEDRRIIDDERLSIERPYTRDWNLRIRDVRYSDQGIYQCQINTNPAKVKTVNLIVLVPAKILDQFSTNDVTVREGDTVTLICNVTGIPHPTVDWYRLLTDFKGVQKQKVGLSGEVLVIHNITRACGDTYECVAFNGVPPAVSRVIEVFVEFAPEIYLPNKRIGQEKGKETILECSVSAFPHAITMWQKDGTKILTSTLKYRVEIYDEQKNSWILSLRIFNIQESDFGTYTCVASNPLGEDKEAMILYDYNEHTRTTAITSTSTSSTEDSYLQPTPGRIFEPFISAEIQRQHTANSDHFLGHDLDPKSRNPVSHRPVYTHPYDSGSLQDSKILADSDTRNTACKDYIPLRVIILTVVITSSPIIHIHSL